jgi:hypothetical protein
MYKSPSSELVELNVKPLNIVVSAGPYTFDVGFGYEPFNELLIKMTQEKPDLLILVNYRKLFVISLCFFINSLLS